MSDTPDGVCTPARGAPSDPGDQMIVFGLLDPSIEVRGILAAASGPVAAPVLYEHVSRLSTRSE